LLPLAPGTHRRASMKRNRGGKEQGQRSISAFFQPKQTDRNVPKSFGKSLSGKDSQAGAGASPSLAGHLNEGEKPQKKAKTSTISGTGADNSHHSLPQKAPVTADPSGYVIPSRSAYRHLRAQTKLAAPPPRETAQGEQNAQAGTGSGSTVPGAAGTSKSRNGRVKYTPLEEQVREAEITNIAK
jgi:hypothetical protein